MPYPRNLIAVLSLSASLAAYAQQPAPKLSAKAYAAAEAEAYAQVKAEAYAAAKAQAEAEAKQAAETAARAKAEADAAAALQAKRDAEEKADEDLREHGRQLLINKMNDPESTRFRGVFLSLSKNVVCGEYNSKNRQGGYNGFRRFYVVLSNGAVATLEENLEKFGSFGYDSSDYVRAYNHNCK